MDKANKGQDRALATETQYNVVNFESKRQGLDAPAKEGPPVSGACCIWGEGVVAGALFSAVHL